jgi:D-alanyl-D-alanine carboxypeptidase
MTVAIHPDQRALMIELDIPENYGSDPLLPIYAEAIELVEAGPNIVGRMQSLTTDTATAWQGMLKATQAEAIELVMVSGFRSIEYQAGLIRNKLAAGQAISEILQVNVAPGYSQHHTGNAIDIATPGYKPLVEEFENSPAFAWLKEHAGRFGFTLSYPRNNPEGIAYKPWHWYRKEI